LLNSVVILITKLECKPNSLKRAKVLDYVW